MTTLRAIIRATLPCALTASAAVAQTQLFQYGGSSSSGLVGTSIAPLGDVNGDGVADWICGDLQYAELENGYALIVSGATGMTLRSFPGLQQGDQFGWCVASCGDTDGDGVPDVVASSNPSGSGSFPPYVRVFSGATGALLHHIVNGGLTSSFGWSLAGAGDVDGDGRGDFIVGAPIQNRAEVYSGSTGQLIHSGLDTTGFVGQFGRSVTGLGDLDGDGRAEFAVGSWSNVRVFRGSDKMPIQTLGGALAGFGTSIAPVADLDSDGLGDLVVGAPGSGHVSIFSSATWMAIFDWTASPPSAGFGADVADAGDVDSDGLHDVIIANNTGAMTWWVYSGRTGAQLMTGSESSNYSRRAVAGLGDLDHDGFDDFAAGYPVHRAGRVKVYSPCPVPPRTYCTAQTNSLGCAPAIGWSGTASWTTGALHLLATQVLNNKTGILFYGLNGRATIPFQGGLQCIAPPRRRTPHQWSGGSFPGDDCTGQFNIDFRAHINSGTDPALVVGVNVNAQYWSRDPGSAGSTNLSNGVEFVICPR